MHRLIKSVRMRVASGDLWGAAAKAPTEPAGEKSEPRVCFSFAGVFFFGQKENAGARTL